MLRKLAHPGSLDHHGQVAGATFRAEDEHMGRILLSIALLAGWSGFAFGQTAPASEIAPGGKLRVGMIAITVLGGVAEPIARFIGQKLGVAVEPVMYPNPDAYASARVNGTSLSGRASLLLRTKQIPRRTFGPSALFMSPRRERSFPISPRSTRPV
jgi:hypothetical protein